MGQRAVREFVSVLVSGDGERALEVLSTHKNKGHSTVEVYDDVVFPALVEIGRRWEEGELDIASEHRAAELVRRATARLSEETKRNSPLGRHAVVACVEGEQHTIGARLLADVLHLDGWDVDYLGANTPTADLVRFVDSKETDLIGLSVTIPEKRSALVHAMATWSERPKPPIVLVGGRAAASIAREDSLLVSSLQDALHQTRVAIGLGGDGPQFDDFLSSLGKRIGTSRKAKGWSQATLAKHAELDRTYVSALERGKQNLTLGAVFKLSQALRLDLDELLAGHQSLRPLP